MASKKQKKKDTTNKPIMSVYRRVSKTKRKRHCRGSKGISKY